MSILLLHVVEDDCACGMCWGGHVTFTIGARAGAQLTVFFFDF